jgi:hypothetical protein
MTTSGDPHEIEETLEQTADYQAPPREEDREDGEEPATYEDGQPIDVNLLEAQRQTPGVQSKEPVVTDPSKAPRAVSGPDERSDAPGAVPPGETM